MIMRKMLKSKPKGSVLALIAVALIILFFTGTGIMSLGLRSRLQAIRTASEIAARCAADAGMTKAVVEMNDKIKVKPWSDSNLPDATNQALPNCNMFFSYSVVPEGNDVYSVSATGDYGQTQKTVNSTLQLRGPFEFAIFMKNSLILKGGTTVDGYNFDADDGPLQIGTNSTAAGAVNSKIGVTIDGDVVVGAGGNPDVVIDSKAEAIITGDTYAAPEEWELDPISVPAGLQALASQGVLIGGTTLSGPAKYDSINVGNSEIVTINGPVVLYVIGDIILDNSAEIRIVDPNTNPDASLTIYLGGNFECKNGGFINNLAQDTTKCKIYGLETCKSIVFMTASIFYGAIYAPNADVQLNNSVEYHGSVVANSFIQNVGAGFHYDAALRNVAVNDEAVRFVVKHWSEL
ncbi:MAG: DUF7305 domain-containing protein [Planctomycetota bacterium]|jgi:hypothetical protein